MLDIVNNSLSQILDLDDWPNLAMLNWIGNRYSDCRELEGWSSHIYVKNDCPRDSLSTIEINEGNKVFLWPFFLMIIPFSLLGLAGGYQIIYRYTRTSINDRVRYVRSEMYNAESPS